MTALALATAPPMLTPTGVCARSARVADAKAISALVDLWADRGLTIRRPLGNVLSSLGDFVVAARTGFPSDVVACGALEAVGGFDVSGIAEIRSIAVDPTAAGLGAGRCVVEHLIAEAEARGLSQLCLLTRTPGFFQRCGFNAVQPAQLPLVYRDEHLAAQGRTCDGRTAMIRQVAQASRL